MNALSGNAIDLAFAWDPTEPVATRPITMQRQGGWNFFYTHDGNKNISDVVSFQQARGIAAHYEYAPFGSVTAATRNTNITAFDVRSLNPYRFSSEYADDTLGLVYYNYRHYNPLDGRWTSRDPSRELGGVNIVCFCINDPLRMSDFLGLGYFDCLSDCISSNDILDKIIDAAISKVIVGSPGIPKIFLEWIARYVMCDENLANQIRLARKLGDPLAWKPAKVIGEWLSMNRTYCAKIAKGHAAVSTVYGVVMAAVELDCAIHCIGECSYDGENLFNIDNAIEYYSEMLMKLFGSD